MCGWLSSLFGRSGNDAPAETGAPVLQRERLDEQEAAILDCYVEMGRLDVRLSHLPALRDSPQAEKGEELAGSLLDLLVASRRLKEGDAVIHVGVIGEFSAGKSSFINSLLGREVCPTSNEPTTSSITRFRYSEDEAAEFAEMDEEWREKRKLEEAEYRQLARHAKDKGADQGGLRFECRYNIPELRSVALYDTPGFNSNDPVRGPRDEQLTLDTLSRVEVILYIVDILTGSLGKDNVRRLEKLHKEGKRIYLVLNKADTMDDPEDQERVLRKCKKDFADFERSLPYSASEEMEGREVFFRSEGHVFPVTRLERGEGREPVLAFRMSDEAADQEKFVKKFRRLLRGNSPYVFTFSNSQEGKEGTLVLELAEAGRTPKREELFAWFGAIRKEKHAYTQRAFARGCEKWVDEAREWLAGLKKTAQAYCDALAAPGSTSQEDGDAFFERVKRRLYEEYCDEMEDHLRAEMENFALNNVRFDPAPKSYFFTPYYQVTLLPDEAGFNAAMAERLAEILKEYTSQMWPLLLREAAGFNRKCEAWLKEIPYEDVLQAVVNELYESWMSWSASLGTNGGEYYEDQSEAETRWMMFVSDVTEKDDPDSEETKVCLRYTFIPLRILSNVLDKLKEYYLHESGKDEKETEKDRERYEALIGHIDEVMAKISGVAPEKAQARRGAA